MIYNDLTTKLKKKLDQAKSDKNNYMTMCEDLNRLVSPNLGDFLSQNEPSVNKIPVSHSSATIQAISEISSRICGMLISDVIFYFKFKQKKLNKVKALTVWLEEVSEIIHSDLEDLDSNFQEQIMSVLFEWFLFGTSILTMQEVKKGFTSFKHIHLSKGYILEAFNGSLDTFILEDQFTARQLIQALQLPDDHIPDSITRAETEEPEKLFKVAFFSMPKHDYELLSGKKLAKEFEIASVWLLEEPECVILRQSGFYSMPAAGGRYRTKPGEIYGRSPAFDAIADIRQLNLTKEMITIGAEFMGKPILMTLDDTIAQSIDYAPDRIWSGALNPDGSSIVQQFQVQVDLNNLRAEAQDLADNIRKAYFLDKLSFPDRNTYQTAYEASLRENEKLYLLAPNLIRFQNEVLKPVIQFIFNVKKNAKLLPPLPEGIDMDKVDLEIQFVSPISKLKKQTQVQGISETLAIVAPLMQINPAVTQVFKSEEMARFVADAKAVPADLLNSAEEVAQAQQQQAQLQQQQILLQQLGQASEIAKNSAAANVDTAKAIGKI